MRAEGSLAPAARAPIPAERSSIPGTTWGFGIALALGAFAAYCATAYRTAPFWDAGEFIAASAILGIPHQPSTPLYVLLGRVASLVPAGTVAFRINILSAAATALAVLFTFFATERLARRMLQTNSRVFAITAGLVAGTLVAFSRTIWFNALEAEVYALSNMMVALALLWVVRWADAAPSQRDVRVLLLVFYLLSLSVAIHLGTYLVLPALLVFVILETTGSWGRTARILGVLGGGFLLLAVAAGTAEGLGAGTASAAVGFLAVSLLALFLVPRFRRPGAVLLLLLLLGLSAHLMLPIRAHLDPVINEGEPDNWQAFWETLTRAQYPPANPLVRRAALAFQFDHMFLRYVREQWPLVPARALGGFFAGLLSMLPLAAAAGGVWAQARRDRSGAALLGVLAAVTGPGMVIYLNFSDHEVRERDYFFTGFYQVTAMWAGIGMAWAARALAGARAGMARAPFSAAAGALVLLVALLPAKNGWFEHDRSHDSIARDYAYNLLAPLPEDAILFTNGDNDTFPLWYLQEVEGIRKDVRVVNLSLLNTPWYIRQLRDYEPRVPIHLSDNEIEALLPTIDPETRKLLITRDLAVRQILKDNRAGVTEAQRAGQRAGRPRYLAVTVPDHMGLDKRLTMEGLAHRIHPEPTEVRIDLEKCRRNVYEVFAPLRGILTAEGKSDWSLHRDENEIRLVQNYAAIHFYMAAEYDKRGEHDLALAEAQRAQQVSPSFSGNRLFLGILHEKRGDWPAAEAHYRQSITATGEDPRLNHRLGYVLVQQGRLAEALPILRKAIELGGPGYFDPYESLFELYLRLGKVEEAVALLDRWLAIHPADAEVRQVRERVARGELVPPPPEEKPPLD